MNDLKYFQISKLACALSNNFQASQPSTAQVASFYMIKQKHFKKLYLMLLTFSTIAIEENPLQKKYTCPEGLLGKLLYFQNS